MGIRALFFGGEDKKDKKDNFFEIRMDNGHVGITT